MKSAEFSDLAGKTVIGINVNRGAGADEIVFTCSDGSAWKLWHRQDCCEDGCIDDISGDLADLLHRPLLVAEERSQSVDEGAPMPADLPDGLTRTPECNTWTFYTLRTIAGTVDIRWHGSSNGYYSERVDFDQIAGPRP